MYRSKPVPAWAPARPPGFRMERAQRFEDIRRAWEARDSDLADLIVAAHADAKKKLDAKQAQMMQEAAGPRAGMMGGLPGMKF